MGRKNKKPPAKKNNNANNQNTPAADPPKRWWQNILETNKVIAGGTVLGAIVIGVVGWFQWDEAHQTNLAAWEQGRAHLVVAATPPSTIEVTTDDSTKSGSYDGLINGKIYIANRGPSDPKNLTIGVVVTIQAIGYLEQWNGNLTITKPLELTVITPPIEIPFKTRFDKQDWMHLVMAGGEIHVRARVAFDDIYGKHIERDDIEAVAPWGSGQVKSFGGAQPLEREFMPPAGPANQK